MQHALFSVSYAGLWGQARLSLEDFIQHAGRLGYRAVMLMGKRPHLASLDMSPDRLAQIQAALAENEVSCAVVAGYTDFSGAGPGEVPNLEMQIAYVADLARIAASLGAKIVRVFTAYENPTMAYAALWERTVTALQECCDRAAAYGTTIAVQNHHDLAVHSDALLELMRDVARPNCKLGFDAWSPALRGENLYEAARKMAPFTACTTNADYVRLPRYQYQPHLVNYQATSPDAVRAVPFGEGCIDYPAFFAGLKEGGFDGVASYEMCSPVRGGGCLDNLDRCSRQYLAWLGQHDIAGANHQGPFAG